MESHIEAVRLLIIDRMSSHVLDMAKANPLATAEHLAEEARKAAHAIRKGVEAYYNPDPPSAGTANDSTTG